MTLDISARGFPRDLDGHPQLAWMGEDWVTFVVAALQRRLAEQDGGSELKIARCTADPELETRVRSDGSLVRVQLTVPAGLLVRDGAARFWWLHGVATFTSDGVVGLDIGTTRRDTLEDVFLEARGWIAREDNDFSWSSWPGAEDALEEIDGILDALARGEEPMVMDVLFCPTGPMQELSLSSGWGRAFLALADRYDAAAALRASATRDPAVRNGGPGQPPGRR